MPTPMPETQVREDELVFEAPTADEALARVTEELGPEASIVNADKVLRGGIKGFFAKEMVQLRVRHGSVEEGTMAAKSTKDVRPPAAASGLYAQGDAEASSLAGAEECADTPHAPPFPAVPASTGETGSHTREEGDAPTAIDSLLAHLSAEEGANEEQSFGELLRQRLDPPVDAQEEGTVTDTTEHTTILPDVEEQADAPGDGRGEAEASGAPQAAPSRAGNGAAAPPPEATATTAPPPGHQAPPSAASGPQAPSSASAPQPPAAPSAPQAPPAPPQPETPTYNGGTPWSTTAAGAPAAPTAAPSPAAPPPPAPAPSAPTAPPAVAPGFTPAPGVPGFSGVPGAVPHGWPSWSGVTLSRLGLPEAFVTATQGVDPADDAAWIHALSNAIAPLCRALPEGPALLIGPNVEPFAAALGIPVVSPDEAITVDGPVAAVLSGMQDRQSWLAAASTERWLHLVAGGFGWERLLFADPMAISWIGEDGLVGAVTAATRLGLSLGYGMTHPQGGIRRATPVDVALAIRTMVPRR